MARKALIVTIIAGLITLAAGSAGAAAKEQCPAGTPTKSPYCARESGPGVNAIGHRSTAFAENRFANIKLRCMLRSSCRGKLYLYGQGAHAAAANARGHGSDQGQRRKHHSSTHRAAVYGAGHYSIHAHKRAIVTASLTKRARRILAAHPKLTVSMVAVADGSHEHLGTLVIVKARRSRHHRG